MGNKQTQQTTLENDLNLLEEIPTNLPGHFDVYALGEPGSGKSNFLGSLLYYATEVNGNITFDIHNTGGRNYALELIETIKNEQFVGGTYNKLINYTGCSFIDKNDTDHPFNFFEMSGEVFLDLFNAREKFVEGEKKTLKKLKEYLWNDNGKILIFTISAIPIGERNDYIEQFNRVDSILKHFDKSKNVLPNTVAIGILITRWDEYKDDAANAEDFMKKHLKALNTTCRKISKNHDIFCQPMIFSLGKTTIDGPGQYKYDTSYPEKCFEWLCVLTPDHKKVSFLSSLSKIFLKKTKVV